MNPVPRRRRVVHARRLRSLVIAASALAATAPVSVLHAQETSAPPTPSPAPDLAIPSASPKAENTFELPPVVVSATRTPQDPAYASSSVTLLSLEELQTYQIVDLPDAIGRQPGVTVVNAGAPGAASSIFIRGANSDHTLFVVDGVPMNSRGARYNPFLGGADLVGVDRVELLRGSQSTLYGSSAIGGVILVDTARGCGPLQGVASASGGSFGAAGASLAVSGGDRHVGVSASVSHERTDNERANNAYEATNAALRVDVAVSPVFVFGGTYRGQRSDYEEPGSITFPFSGNVDFVNRLGTLYGEWSPGADFRSRLTLGLHRREYTYTSGFGSDLVTSERRLLEWQNTWEAADWLELVAGVSANREHDDWSGTDYVEDQVAGYALVTVKPAKEFVLTAGLRRDHFESYGDETTGRLGAAWRLPASGTKLRATYGTGFQAPGADDRYGVPAYFQPANPNVVPERSRAWDVGVDQEFFGGRLLVSATYFETRFDDLFSFDPVTFATINIPDAEARGVELGLVARPLDNVTLHAGYTWLEAENLTDDVRLIRRPRHSVTLDGDWRVTEAWSVGAGLRAVIDRVDGDVYSPVSAEDYTVVRVFAAWRARRDLTLRARVENILDENYSETAGYPGLPLAFYASAEWRF